MARIPDFEKRVSVLKAFFKHNAIIFYANSSCLITALKMHENAENV